MAHRSIQERPYTAGGGMPQEMSEPTPTSYAIQALLSLRPWSAYELTGFMRTSNLRGIWPRAESRLYAEPKNLVAQDCQFGLRILAMESRLSGAREANVQHLCRNRALSLLATVS